MDSGYISSRTIVAHWFSDGKENGETVSESTGGANRHAILDFGYFGMV